MPFCILPHEFNIFKHLKITMITLWNPIDLYVWLDLVTEYPKEKYGA